MTINFSNDDRTSLNAFLNTDLGQKFIRALEQGRPRVQGTEINALAIAGATTQGYEMALEQIDSMRQVKGPGIPSVKYVETHTD
jgi:hypothetical protein